MQTELGHKGHAKNKEKEKQSVVAKCWKFNDMNKLGARRKS
jgi:hypothetical protein